MRARRATTRIWKTRGGHHERTITRKDASSKLIRKINVREFFQMLACSLEHGFWIFLCAPLCYAQACGAREFLLAVLIGTTSQAFGASSLWPKRSSRALTLVFICATV